METCHKWLLIRTCELWCGENQGQISYGFIHIQVVLFINRIGAIEPWKMSAWDCIE
ncbi:Hypothetical protein CINCED_3A018396 [Cinara cedri]|uniref:Uncharacterized protein n=1 Tax=Cinara cedri TaxID=506608 RepID=A0A5E4MV71_9HEMI|nr:Hypothetical protein CINCED_3A018396 [Cinara cedri]